MSENKFTDHLTRMRCEKCNNLNYYTRKNDKSVKKKLEFKKFCSNCRKHTVHKESKR